MQKLFLVSSILSFIYGIVMLFTNVTPSFFLIWSIAGIICFGIYMLYKINIISKIPNWIRKTALSFFIIFLVIILFTSYKIILCFSSNSNRDVHLDYVLVLGALVTNEGPSLSGQYRLDKAIEYLNADDNLKCVISGGKGTNETKPEARVMADYLISNGISEERLLLEENSSNTFENFSFSKKYIDVERDVVGIVTNDFHVYRSMQIAKKMGYKNICGIPAYSLPINLISTVLREAVAVIVYKLRNRI